MLLTADVGNSYISLGCYEGDSLRFVSELHTDLKKSSDQYAVELLQIMKLYDVEREELDGAVISSVVPELTEIIRNAIYKISGTKAMAVGPGVKNGLKIKIDNPAQLGADMVATAVAAVEGYSLPAIICDFGTATTFGIIDKDKSFCGMIIAAGVGTTLDGFTDKTALLPQVSIEKPKRLIGKNTVESIQSGLINGTAAMVDGLIERLKKELGDEVKVIATGKYAAKIVGQCEEEIEIAQYLAFEGLKSIYRKNKQV